MAEAKKEKIYELEQGDELFSPCHDISSEKLNQIKVLSQKDISIFANPAQQTLLQDLANKQLSDESKAKGDAKRFSAWQGKIIFDKIDELKLLPPVLNNIITQYAINFQHIHVPRNFQTYDEAEALNTLCSDEAFQKIRKHYQNNKLFAYESLRPFFHRLSYNISNIFNRPQNFTYIPAHLYSLLKNLHLACKALAEGQMVFKTENNFFLDGILGIENSKRFDVEVFAFNFFILATTRCILPVPEYGAVISLFDFLELNRQRLRPETYEKIAKIFMGLNPKLVGLMLDYYYDQQVQFVFRLKEEVADDLCAYARHRRRLTLDESKASSKCPTNLAEALSSLQIKYTDLNNSSGVYHIRLKKDDWQALRGFTKESLKNKRYEIDDGERLFLLFPTQPSLNDIKNKKNISILAKHSEREHLLINRESDFKKNEASSEEIYDSITGLKIFPNYLSKAIVDYCRVQNLLQNESEAKILSGIHKDPSLRRAIILEPSIEKSMKDFSLLHFIHQLNSKISQIKECLNRLRLETYDEDTLYDAKLAAISQKNNIIYKYIAVIDLLTDLELACDTLINHKSKFQKHKKVSVKPVSYDEAVSDYFRFDYYGYYIRGNAEIFAFNFLALAVIQPLKFIGDNITCTLYEHLRTLATTFLIPGSTSLLENIEHAFGPRCQALVQFILKHQEAMQQVEFNFIVKKEMADKIVSYAAYEWDLRSKESKMPFRKPSSLLTALNFFEVVYSFLGEESMHDYTLRLNKCGWQQMLNIYRKARLYDAINIYSPSRLTFWNPVTDCLQAQSVLRQQVAQTSFLDNNSVQQFINNQVIPVSLEVAIMTDKNFADMISTLLKEANLFLTDSTSMVQNLRMAR